MAVRSIVRATSALQLLAQRQGSVTPPEAHELEPHVQEIERRLGRTPYPSAAEVGELVILFFGSGALLEPYRASFVASFRTLPEEQQRRAGAYVAENHREQEIPLPELNGGELGVPFAEGIIDEARSLLERTFWLVQLLAQRLNTIQRSPLSGKTVGLLHDANMVEAAMEGMLASATERVPEKMLDEWRKSGGTPYRILLTLLGAAALPAQWENRLEAIVRERNVPVLSDLHRLLIAIAKGGSEVE